MPEEELEEKPQQNSNQIKSSNPFKDTEWTRWVLSFVFLVLVPLFLFIIFWKIWDHNIWLMVTIGLIYLIPTILLLIPAIKSNDKEKNEK